VALVEIFLNYDCDFDSIDLFKRIVNALAKVAKGRAAADFAGNRRTEKEELRLRMLGLESLASIVQSLVDSARLDEEDEAAKKKGLARRELEEDQAEEEADQQAAAAALAQAAEAAQAAQAAVAEEAGTATKAVGASASVSASAKPKGESSVIDAYAAKQALEEDFTAAILKFNLKPKDGIKYLVSKGRLAKDDAAATAAFLFARREQLDKTVVGDFLGKELQYVTVTSARSLARPPAMAY
jgi:brefeldin A-inhibited guanine nucleotide-exchange protein